MTLTYEDKYLPISIGSSTGSAQASLEPKDLNTYLRYLRRTIKPLEMRYFAAGEYSPPPKNRPHYHIIVFGLPGCQRGQTSVQRINQYGSCCPNCTKYAKLWKKGFVFVGSVTPQSIEYTLDYTMKKLMGKMADLYDGRYPEFSRMSRRPGIGYNMVDDVAEGVRNMEKRGQFLKDVPIGLKIGKKFNPLNPLFRRKIREALGREPTAPKEAQIEHSEKLLPLLALARLSETSLAKITALSTSQKALNMETKLNIHKARKKLT